jgi:hypothetical protein
MATLAFAAAGAAVGGALLPGGVSLLGLTLSGAAIGAQVGALAGTYVDQSLTATSGATRVSEGPRLSDLRVMTAREGAAIPRLYGRARLGGQLIWATDFEEEVITTTSGTGGSGKGRPASSSSGATSTSTTYRYYANIAVGLCEGPITSIGRVWADGRLLDLSGLVWRLHAGDATQQPDSLVSARLGAGNAPAYRGLAYVVFERLPLAAYGNRIPQLSFEVFRAVDDLERRIRSVTLIPGGGEFVYATTPVTRRLSTTRSAAENTHTRQGGTDLSVALDQLQATLPGVAHVSLVVGWFGTDLRAETCRIAPRVDSLDKDTTPLVWSVAGLTRDTATRVSLHEGRPAYGGTPSDQSVIEAIVSLKSRGFAVTLAPFLFMDVPQGNALPDPYGSSAGQAAYPWRGRITVTPAPGRSGSPDNTSAAGAALADFIGTVTPADFTIADGIVSYTGPDEWSYRRFILHQAALAKAAGGVAAFLIGSEMRGLTQVRASSTTYPFVAALVALAADVKAMLGATTKITYAADWTEYAGHHPVEAPADTIFNLDPLWASADIDAIGIDVYWPLADWRDGQAHLDAQAGASSLYDLDYLRGNIAGGEFYDWYYASAADRDAQVRTPITDGAGKPWLYRAKDLAGWWSAPHHHRIAGADVATPTAWVPRSKPFWFTELGCPAVDKGANAPNVFVDAKSAETALPHYSRGTRDDFIQRRYLDAILSAFDPADPAYAGLNPVSPLTGARMVDLDRISVYTWDARPWPAFPNDGATWGDAENWRLGHWITGRFANAPLSATLAALLADFGFTAFDVGGVTGAIAGLVVDRVMSARDALQSVQLAAFIDIRESSGRLVFATRGQARPVAQLTRDDLVEARPGASLLKLTRTQEADLPASTKLTFISGTGDYASAVEEARRITGAATRVATADLGLVLDAEQAAQIAEMWLFETWAARERAAFSVPPRRLALEPGDTVVIDDGARHHDLRLLEIGDHGARDMRAVTVDAAVYAPARVTRRSDFTDTAVETGQPLVQFLDLPLLRGDDPATCGYLAAAREPWPGGVAFYRAPEASGFVLEAIATASATTGHTLDAFPVQPSGRLVHGSLRVALDSGSLASVTDLALWAGANLAAVGNADGEWEVFQFRNASLQAPGVYLLSQFLRGQGGSEHAMRAPLAAGAPFVLLDAAVTRADLTLDEVGLPLTWRCGPSNRPIGDDTYVGLTHGFHGIGARPLAPVHLRAARADNGDITLGWVRRTRSGGDTWEALDVPLAETSELYAIDVLSGASLVRTLAATQPAVVYSASQQASDFGIGPVPSLTFRVAQVSATFGRGIAATLTL